MSGELDRELAGVEALLRQHAGTLVYPPTPPIAAAVAVWLRSEPRPPGIGEKLRGWFGKPLLRPALAVLVAVAVVAAGVALAIPQSRTALADFFGLSGVRIDREPATGPTPPELALQSFAKPATIAEVEEAVDFPLRYPTRDGRRLEPDAVYLSAYYTSLPVPIFVYEDEGYDLYHRDRGSFGKGGPDPSMITEVEFDGRPAIWVPEGGHIAESYDASGRLIVETKRSVDRATLLWERDGVTYRLETSLPFEEAIRVAQSLQ